MSNASNMPRARDYSAALSDYQKASALDTAGNYLAMKRMNPPDFHPLKIPYGPEDVTQEEFWDKFNTQLSPEEEAQFLKWAEAESIRQAAARGRPRNVLMDQADYDIRGFWKAMNQGDAEISENMHGPDRFKKPNHPTFSNESMYHGVNGYEGGVWKTEKKNGENVNYFKPGKTNAELFTIPRLREYWKTQEPNVILDVPPQNGSIIFDPDTYWDELDRTNPEAVKEYGNNMIFL